MGGGYNISACVCPFVLTDASLSVEYFNVLYLHLRVRVNVTIRKKHIQQLTISLSMVCVFVCMCACVLMTAISNTWWITHHHNLHNFEVFIALARQLQ